jgi:hypothetical protein
VQAFPVWLPEVTSAAFCLTASAIDRATGADTGLRFPSLPNVEHILLDTAGRQHVILRATGGSLQLTIAGARSPISPIALSLRVESGRGLAAAARQLTKLQSVLSTTRPQTDALPRWSAHSQRLRDGLIALDGRRTGATFREIAAFIYGTERIRRDWPGSGLKVRVHRDYQRGLALCNGGYRSLLV